MSDGVSAWTGPSDLRAQVQRRWDRGQLLAARARGETLFPLRLRLKRPSSSQLGERFDEVRRWVRALEEGSKSHRGHGYELAWKEISHRQLGKNRLPASAAIPIEEDALKLIGKSREAARFDELFRLTSELCPALIGWIARKPLALLEHGDDWARVLAVLTWFQAHPRPGIYLRQLDVPGVDTKFIEARKPLLTELLDIVLPEAALDTRWSGIRAFEQRYGLLGRPAYVRLRTLDAALHIGGLRDVSARPDELARLQLPIRAVFMTENDVNGLAFPAVPGGVVVSGLGYGIERLAGIPWLADRPLLYWGDIDTHGFAILDRLRALFPHAQSFLMERATLLDHRELWGQELPQQRHERDLSRLTQDESELYEDLRRDRIAKRLRLEQERLPFGVVVEAVELALRSRS